MSSIVSTALSLLRQTWRQMLAIHLVYTGLGIILFAPLLGALSQLLLRLSGKPALADMDMLFFALSPAGAVAVVLFAAVVIVISTFELASMMAVGVARASNQPIGLYETLLFALRRAAPLFRFAGRLVIKLLLTVVPFLLAGAGVAWLLLTNYDINYYLSVQPREFWLAAAVIGLILVAMFWLLIRRLLSWSLALPLVLFAGTLSADSFTASERLTRENKVVILRALALWAAAALLLGGMITIVVQLLAGLLVPLGLNSVKLLAVLFALLLGLWSIINVITTAYVLGGLALLLVTVTRELQPDFQVVELRSGEQVEATMGINLRRWFLPGLVALLCIAMFAGYRLLSEIQVADDVQIIAHRGAAGAAPENTMAAFRQAVADETDWVELDVQESADGEIVVIHDSDFMKLSGVNLKVWEATMEQVAGIDIGSWFAPEFAAERAPLLADVLAEFRGQAKFIVELKYYGHDQQLEQRVINLIEAAGMQSDIMLMSLEYAGIQKVRSLRPDWKVGLLSARAVGRLTQLDADFLAVNLALAKPTLLQAAHAAGKELYVWTVNDALAMSQMMSLGVDGIITDEPRLAREVLAARAELGSVERLLLQMAPVLGIEAPSLSIESDDADGAHGDPAQSSSL